jgi:hypothetical protein
MEWTVRQPFTGHGLALWSVTELGGSTQVSCAPGSKGGIGQVFFPWPEPVPLASGALVRVALAAKPSDDDYVWSWSTEVLNGRGAATHDFRQSTLYSGEVGTRVVRAALPSFVPPASDDMEVDRFILETVDGRRSLDEIAHAVRTRFNGRFADGDTALDRVRAVTRRYVR